MAKLAITLYMQGNIRAFVIGQQPAKLANAKSFLQFQFVSAWVGMVLGNQESQGLGGCPEKLHTKYHT